MLEKDDGAKERRLRARKQMAQIRTTRHKAKRFAELKLKVRNFFVVVFVFVFDCWLLVFGLWFLVILSLVVGCSTFGSSELLQT